MKHHAVRVLTALAFTSAFTLTMASSASAHVEKDFGPVHIEMGFGTEPAYAGQPNSVFLGIERNGEPVADLTDTLKVTVSYSSQTADFPIVPNFEVGGDGTPGDYRAWFIASQPGKYTFHVSGTVDGTNVNWTETSSTSTFDAVQDPGVASFPKVTAPSSQQLYTLMTAQAARLQASADSANAAATRARTVGLIGVLLGAVGAIAAIGAIVRARKSP
ncbi:MAG: hypothetical protein M3P11_08290 [Actinomycetota bacterium]|nr:hypothetical protein [Actinomycetota bacterium]